MKYIFDVGANNGSSCLKFTEDPEITVVGFEPTPEMYSIIEENIVDINNYVLVKKAVSNFTGKAIFNVAGQSDWGCSSLLEFSEKSVTHWRNRKDFKVTHQIEVDVITLEDFVTEMGIEEIEYLHCDTQGSDLNVLKGLGKKLGILKSGVIEAGAEEDILYKNQNTVDECVAFLTENGFKIDGIDDNDKCSTSHSACEVNIRFSKK